MTTRPTLLIIDGNAIMHRAYHALPQLTTQEGTPTNVIYGFLTILHKAINDFKPSHLVVCFDTPVPTFRKKMFKEYQAHRPKIADDFIAQIIPLKSLLDQAGIYRLEKEGYEADDLIGTLTQKCKKDDLQILIMTGDRDIMQLIDENVYVVAPQSGLSQVMLYDKSKVLDKFGVLPNLIPDYKALVGDASDNYKGAKGIGPKTAVKLLNRFSSIEHLLTRLEEIEEDRLKKIILNSQENIILSKKLATIDKNVDIPFSLEKSGFTSFQPALKEGLTKLALFSLIKRFFEQKSVPDKKKDSNKNQLNLF